MPKTRRSVPKAFAISTVASSDLMKTGVFLEDYEMERACHGYEKTNRHPGLLKILSTCLTVSLRTFGGVISIYSTRTS